MENHGLKEAIENLQQTTGDDIRVIADDGYFKKDLLGILSFRNEFDPRDIAWFKDRALSRHEQFNGYTKRFKVLEERFSHDHTSGNPNGEFPMHKACVEAICVTKERLALPGAP